ncbi:cyclin-dependent kinase inhibitor 3-like [Branchiostoma floridae x Branchiostoma japonicum]
MSQSETSMQTRRNLKGLQAGHNMPVKLPIVTASDEEMSQFDSSDSEEEGQLQTDPLQVDWLSLSSVGCEESLGICALPGCRFKETWRSLDADLEDLKAQSICDIFVLCTRGELNKYRVPRLLERYEDADFTVHHHSFPDGTVPAMAACVKLLEEMKVCLSQGKKTLIHCYGGLGRSCLVAACLMLYLDETADPQAALQRVQQVRGHGAVQTVRQYNFLNDFRKNLEEYEASDEAQAQQRSLSR